MADKLKVPFLRPNGVATEEIGTIMNVTEAKDPEIEYLLEDGTKLRIKTMLINAVKLDNEKAPNGDPIYVVNAQQVMTIIPKL
jgi:hypothetical protein